MSGLVVAGALVLAGCSSSGGGSSTPSVSPTSRTTPKSLLEQSPFANCADFRAYYADSLAQEYLTGYAYGGGCFGCEPAINAEDSVGSGTDSNIAPSPAAPDAERVVTETNTQESGVDEADLVEADPDSSELYFLRQETNEVLILDTSDPAAPRILSRIELDDVWRGGGLYLDIANDRLVVVRQKGRHLYPGAPAISASVVPSDMAIGPGAPSQDFTLGTEMLFFDVSDPETPSRINRFVSDGQLIGSRRVGDRIHLITQFAFPAPATLREDEDFRELVGQRYPRALRAGDKDDIAGLETAIRDAIRAAVDATPVAELLPQRRHGGGPETTLACDAILRPSIDTRLGLLTLISIDTDGSAPATLGSINNSWGVYGSRDNLYLFQTSTGWWFDTGQRQQTAIYRFAVGDGQAQPGGVALADGLVGNSYQLSEFDGALRVAATEGRFEEPGLPFRQLNHLQIFDAQRMEEIGELHDFVRDKPRETIRAVRFLDDRGFVVTFEQIDPLFTFDLSDPADPKLLGQVDIPGFASYIAPLGTDHLLTIGRAGGEGDIGVGRGYQLRVFDVTDLTAPTPLGADTPPLRDDEYAYSLAEYEPLAFQFLADAGRDNAGLLSIPAQISSPDPERALSGFLAYRIDPALGSESISEYARIDHKDERAGEGDRCPPQREALPPEGCGNFAPVIYNEPLRSVIVRETNARSLLFSFSSAKLKVLDASNQQPQPLATLSFQP
jgi:hypothetical protein